MSKNLRDKMFTTTAEYKAVGRYIKRTDPSMVEWLRDHGYSTTPLAIGEVIEQSDLMNFDQILHSLD